PPVRGIAAGELDDGEGGRVAHRPPERRDALRQGALTRSELLRRRYGFEDAGQAVVQVLHAEEVVQHPFGKAERARGEGVAGTQLEQSPTAQTRVRRQGAPVRAGEGVERQAEGRIVAL